MLHVELVEFIGLESARLFSNFSESRVRMYHVSQQSNTLVSLCTIRDWRHLQVYIRLAKGIMAGMQHDKITSDIPCHKVSTFGGRELKSSVHGLTSQSMNEFVNGGLEAWRSWPGAGRCKLCYRLGECSNGSNAFAASHRQKNSHLEISTFVNFGSPQSHHHQHHHHHHHHKTRRLFQSDSESNPDRFR